MNCNSLSIVHLNICHLLIKLDFIQAELNNYVIVIEINDIRNE